MMHRISFAVLAGMTSLLVAAACSHLKSGPAPVIDGSDPVFSDAEEFIPPKHLPIVDVLNENQLTLDTDELAAQLTAVSVTPAGEVQEVPIDPEDIEIFLEAIAETDEEEFDAGSSGSEAAEAAGAADSAGVSEYEGLGVMPESVIGTDQRRRVTATTRYPWRTVGRIDIGCTGTLIGPRHVLTAGHCVYNIRTDKWYSRLNFSPGQNGSSRPHGTVAWKRAISVKGWTKNHKRNYDYAMIVLRKNVGNRLGWLGYGWKSKLPKYNVNINGYPGDKPFGTMWHSFCKLQIITKFRLYYPCDTAGGMSGSGVYVYTKNPTRRIIYGIHAYGVDSTGLNGATRIRKAVFENLKRWKASY